MSTMQALESTVREHVSGGSAEVLTAAGIALAAESRDASFKYTNVFGKSSMKPDAEDLTVDSVMWMASCTKLVTAVAVMQCVERGLLTLDEDITRLLPEWKDADILVGFDDAGEPVLKKAQQKITMRKLLSHTSGMVYHHLNPKLKKYVEYLRAKGVPEPGPFEVATFYFYPLAFEPGEAWEYGCSIDWAGLAVGRVNNIGYGEYLEKNILGPLGMTSTTFDPIAHPDIMRRLAGVAVRLPDGGLVSSTNAGPPWGSLVGPKQPAMEGGGGNLYSTTTDYLKFLTAILRNDGVLLKQETVAELYEPQLDASFFQNELSGVGSLERSIMNLQGGDTTCAWALGGLVILADLPDGRRKGTMSWSGAANCHWWIDPQSKLCGLYMAQVVPTDDPKTFEMYGAFQKAVYEAAA